jgi:hypothetical protein
MRNWELDELFSDRWTIKPGSTGSWPFRLFNSLYFNQENEERMFSKTLYTNNTRLHGTMTQNTTNFKVILYLVCSCGCSKAGMCAIVLAYGDPSRQ